MSIVLSNRELTKRSSELAMLSGNSCMLMGSTGVGKTDMMQQIADSNGKRLITLNAAIQSVEDLTGYPYRDPTDNKMKWARPEWFPDQPNSILFVDELNRAEKQVINALMPMLLNGVLHQNKLPEGTWICAACNPDSEDYDMVNSFGDLAIWSRFCTIKVQADPSDWIKWLKQNNLYEASIAETLAADIAEKDKQLDQLTIPTAVSNRSCTKAINIINKAVEENKIRNDKYFTEEVVMNCLNGTVGSELASKIQPEVLVKLNTKDFDKSFIELLESEMDPDLALVVRKRIKDKFCAENIDDDEYHAVIDWLKKYKSVFPDIVREIVSTSNDGAGYKRMTETDDFFDVVCVD